MAERELQLDLTTRRRTCSSRRAGIRDGRPSLRRAIQRYIEDPLADFVLRSQLPPARR